MDRRFLGDIMKKLFTDNIDLIFSATIGTIIGRMLYEFIKFLIFL